MHIYNFYFISFCSTFLLVCFVPLHRHHNPIYGTFLCFSLLCRLLFSGCLFFLLAKMQILQLSVTKYCLADRVGLCHKSLKLILTGTLHFKGFWVSDLSTNLLNSEGSFLWIISLHFLHSNEICSAAFFEIQKKIHLCCNPQIHT